jgi:hypothetical protein
MRTRNGGSERWHAPLSPSAVAVQNAAAVALLTFLKRHAGSLIFAGI